MKKKNLYYIIFILLVIILTIVYIRFFQNNEDDWIKDSRGVYIKHGNPSETPLYVKEQQSIIKCAKGLYLEEDLKGVNFDSQCLGTCLDYAIDIVNNPRIDKDNLVENQCMDYREGKVSHFIELDSNGEIVRII